MSSEKQSKTDGPSDSISTSTTPDPLIRPPEEPRIYWGSKARQKNLPPGTWERLPHRPYWIQYAVDMKRRLDAEKIHSAGENKTE